MTISFIVLYLDFMSNITVGDVNIMFEMSAVYSSSDSDSDLAETERLRDAVYGIVLFNLNLFIWLSKLEVVNFDEVCLYVKS